MAQLAQAPDPAAVLTRATLRAAERLNLSQRELASLLGVSAASLSRLVGRRRIDPQSKEGELAALFVRVFRSLDSLVGGDESAAQKWLRADNVHLGGVPAELMASVTGMVRVVDYLDALRGKL
jgi:uncharacterized protein (DUF2384 family)